MSKSIEEMPEYLSTQHLIQLCIYARIDAAYTARIQGYSPPFIKLRHKILYSKKSVIEFLERRKNPGDSSHPDQNSVNIPQTPASTENQ